MFPYIEEPGGGIMETMILLAVLIIIVIIGFFIMKRLGIFIDEVEDENKKDHGKK